MLENMSVAIVAASGAILVALIGSIFAMLARLRVQIHQLEHRDRLNWLYIRTLIDHAYRHKALPLPEPPDGWLDE